jgi:hypothetical protein
MEVPSSISTWLKNELGLQHIARPLHVQVDAVLGGNALCERDDLQRVHLAARSARAD